MRRLVPLFLLTIVGCRPTAEPTPPAADAPSPTRVPAPEAEPAPPASEAPVLLEGASLGGAPLTLREDGTLVLGAKRGTVEIPGPDKFWMEQQAALREVDLGGGTTAVFVELPLPEEEDPPNRVQVFVAEGNALRRVWDWTPSGYGPVPIEAPGDGTIRYTQDGWTACIEAKHPKTPVPLMTVTLALEGEPAVFVETERKPSGKTQKCDELAG